MENLNAAKRHPNADTEDTSLHAPKKRKLNQDTSSAEEKDRKRKLDHDAYTVGWVCVLRVELNAARAMLDEEHERLPQLEKDDNSYLLGRIGEHNVVIAFTGSGSYGKSVAAQTTTNMARTFRNIRFGLLVGVGGGAPKPPDPADAWKDIRLGDIVVGSAKGSHGGVFHSDMGKWRGDGEFHVESHLNKPPKILSKAIELLQSDHDFGEGEIQKFLSEATKRFALRNAGFPGRENDLLFKSDHDHIGGDDCSECDATLLEKRITRESDNPMVHYGLIASGDAVMRSAILRDKLRDTHGVVCFEMEAAGIVDDFPCAVIRGICDYSDGHKNKLWQPYSAVVAAAYAKDLLRVMQPQEVETMDTVATIIKPVHQQLKAIRSTLETNEILQWLTPTDYGRQQSDCKQRREPGTGQWFLGSVQYKAWVEAERGILFCPGIPGAGKTILTSIVVDNLTDRFRTNTTIGLAYVYFNFRRQDEQKPEDLLANLLKQLVQGCTPIAEAVKSLYDNHKDKQTRPSLDELLQAFQHTTTSYSKIFIIIDALDESNPDERGREKLLSTIFRLQIIENINIFTTSRFIPDITSKFQSSQVLEIRATTADIQTYITGYMSELPSVIRDNPELQSEIATAIADAVDGMFLLAKIYLNSLDDKITTRAVKNAIMHFRKQKPGSSEDQKREVLDQAYDDLMERVNLQKPGFRQLAVSVLSWVVCAKRPLSTLELQHALAVKIGDSEPDEENLPVIENTIQVCAGLVTINKEVGVIGLVHYTTQEYLERTQKHWFPAAKDDITTTCLTYLSFSAFNGGYIQTEAGLKERLRLYPFYDYAARNWGHHARAASIESRSATLEFLENDAIVSASSQAMMANTVYLGHDQSLPWLMKGVHFAAYFGLPDMLANLLDKSHFSDGKDTYGRTPLLWAAERGHAEVVKLLLTRRDVDVNSEDSVGRTALSLAAENGHEMVLRLLLADEVGVDINATDIYDQSSLFWAIEEGRELVVKLLIARTDIDTNSKDIFGQTPLHLSITRGNKFLVEALLANKSVDPNLRNGEDIAPLILAVRKDCEAIVKLLLERDDIHPNSDDYGQTILRWAVRNGHKGIVQLILSKGVNIEVKEVSDHMTPLWWAVLGGHESIVQLLLDKGANIEAEHMSDYTTPLWWAASEGYEGIVQLLLDKGANIEVKEVSDHMTPLWQAVLGGHESIVQLLLDKGANIETEHMSEHTTPLWWAACKGHESIVQLLLDKGANTEVVFDNMTPLLWAAHNGHASIVQLLLDKGANIEAEHMSNHTTPLWQAAYGGHKGIVQLLLDKGANIEAEHMSDHKTPLWWAAYKGHESIVQLLLDKGANIKVFNKDLQTLVMIARMHGYKKIISLLEEHDRLFS